LLSGGSSIAIAYIGITPASAIVSASDSVVVLIVGDGNPSGVSLTADVSLVADTAPICAVASVWTYGPSTNVSSATPTSGQYGTRITLTGTGLRAYGAHVTNATVAGITASIVSESDSQAVVAAGSGPSNGAAAGDIVITANTGAHYTISSAFTYIAVGTIIVVSPSSGQAGTAVAISGLRLCGGGSYIASVTLAGMSANITGQTNCNYVTVTAQDFGANITGSVVVIADTGATTTIQDAWTYIAAGYISSVAPNAGQAGDRVTIKGVQIFGGGTSATQVYLGSVPATILVNGNTTYMVVSANQPSGGASGSGDVLIIGSTGVPVRLVNGWTYSTISSIVPNSGQKGTVVTILGTALLAAGTQPTSVLLGNVAASVQSYSATNITVVAGSNLVFQDQPGFVKINTNSGQAVTSAADTWTYKPPSQIASVFPSQGQVGSLVTISGSNLLGYGSSIASVQLAGASASSIVFFNDSEIVAVAAAHGAAVGSVTITADTGATASLVAAWRYVTPGTISSVSPSSGQVNTLVTITCTGLLSGASSLSGVLLGGVAASRIVSASDTVVIVAASSGNASNADSSVHVLSQYGSDVSAANAWNYTADGSISSFFPTSGQYGTLVTVNGARLLGAGSAVVNATISGAVAQVVNYTNTIVLLQAGSTAPGSGAIVLFADSGATVTSVSTFTYLVAGVIANVTPGSGQAGTRVTITGQALLGGGATAAGVTFGGVAATIVSATNTTVIVQAGDKASAGAVDVAVISNTNANVVSSNGWTYLLRGVVGSVTPNNGIYGTVVTIRGSRLLGGGQYVAFASLAGVPAAILSGNDTTVVIVANASSNPNSVVQGDVVLQSDTGSIVLSSNGWTYTVSSQISSISPTSGAVGTLVNVYGSRLLGGGSKIVSASLGGIAVLNVTFSNDTLVQVAAGANVVASTGFVVLVSDTGATTSFYGWTYATPAVISNVYPGSGQVAPAALYMAAICLAAGRRLFKRR